MAAASVPSFTHGTQHPIKPAPGSGGSTALRMERTPEQGGAQAGRVSCLQTWDRDREERGSGADALPCTSGGEQGRAVCWMAGAPNPRHPHWRRARNIPEHAWGCRHGAVNTPNKQRENEAKSRNGTCSVGQKRLERARSASALSAPLITGYCFHCSLCSPPCLTSALAHSRSLSLSGSDITLFLPLPPPPSLSGVPRPLCLAVAPPRDRPHPVPRVQPAALCRGAGPASQVGGGPLPSWKVPSLPWPPLRKSLPCHRGPPCLASAPLLQLPGPSPPHWPAAGAAPRFIWRQRPYLLDRISGGSASVWLK